MRYLIILAIAILPMFVNAEIFRGHTSDTWTYTHNGSRGLATMLAGSYVDGRLSLLKKKKKSNTSIGSSISLIHGNRRNLRFDGIYVLKDGEYINLNSFKSCYGDHPSNKDFTISDNDVSYSIICRVTISKDDLMNLVDGEKIRIDYLYGRASEGRLTYSLNGSSKAINTIMDGVGIDIFN